MEVQELTAQVERVSQVYASLLASTGTQTGSSVPPKTHELAVTLCARLAQGEPRRRDPRQSLSPLPAMSQARYRLGSCT